MGVGIITEAARGSLPGENRGQNTLPCLRLCYLIPTAVKLKVSGTVQVQNILHNPRSAKLHVICTTAILTAFVIIMVKSVKLHLNEDTLKNTILVLGMRKF